MTIFVFVAALLRQSVGPKLIYAHSSAHAGWPLEGRLAPATTGESETASGGVMLETRSLRGAPDTNWTSKPLPVPHASLMASMRHVKANQDDVCYVVAKYDYAAQGAQELDLRKNERYMLVDDSKHWWRVQNSRNQSGYVPSNYVKKEKPSLFDR